MIVIKLVSSLSIPESLLW